MHSMQRIDYVASRFYLVDEIDAVTTNYFIVLGTEY